LTPAPISGRVGPLPPGASVPFVKDPEADSYQSLAPLPTHRRRAFRRKAIAVGTLLVLLTIASALAPALGH
jgi:hypothetical protein